MQNQTTFKRYEIKYLITAKQKQKIIEAMQTYMQEDSFGRSTICNIYYDTPDSILIRRSLEKPVYKEKLRVRSYGRAKADTEVYVELKKKYKGVVYKRRVLVTQREAEAYLNECRPLPVQNQITEELDYFIKFYGNLKPAVFLSYEREAFYGKEDKDLRITFDENILWRKEDISLCSKIYGASILEKDFVLMEIKVTLAMPLWLTGLLSELQIYNTSFSKYGHAYLQQLMHDTEEAESFIA